MGEFDLFLHPFDAQQKERNSRSATVSVARRGAALRDQAVAILPLQPIPNPKFIVPQANFPGNIL
jgi:hypothetical protein